MNRTLLLPLALGAVLMAPAVHARTIVVTDANNEKTVTLHKGDTLLVRLAFNTTTGYSWHIVYEPDGRCGLTETVKPHGWIIVPVWAA